jgi:ABC-2 type transport system permease protein
MSDSAGTATAAPMARRPAALRPLVGLVARGLLGRRRTAAVALLAVSPVLVGLVLAFAGTLGNPEALAVDVFSTLTLALVIPLVGLVLGTSALGTAIDDGTIVYVLVKPVRRRAVGAAAVLVAATATAVLTSIGVAGSGLLIAGAGSATLVASMLVGGILASVLYAAVFVALSVVTGRALVVGLAYVLVWEGFVTTLLEGTRILSIREYALAIVGALGGDVASAEVGTGVEPITALVLSAVVLGGSFAVATWRLGRFEVADGG